MTTMSASDRFDHEYTSDATGEVFQSVITGRKSWKVLKGERVWPPSLEAALIEGLEAYKPVDSRETRMLGRFPMRNRFISDYIFHTTGKRRTPKQVGSRLQQLRDTCGGKRFLKLLSRPTRPDSTPGCSSFILRTPLHYSESAKLPPLRTDIRWSDAGSSDSESSTSPIDSYKIPDPLDQPATTLISRPPPRTQVCIDILPDLTASSSMSGISSDNSGSSLLQATSSSQATSDESNNIFRPSAYPRLLRDIDPTLTFISPSTITAVSEFSVLVDGTCVHSEEASLTLVEDTAESINSRGLLYGTQLVPRYWETICNSNDPPQYTIHQDIKRKHNPASWPACMAPTDIIFSAVYTFKYPSNTSVPVVRVSPAPSICSTSADSLAMSSPAFPLYEAIFSDSFPWNSISHNDTDSSCEMAEDRGSQGGDPFDLDSLFDGVMFTDPLVTPDHHTAGHNNMRTLTSPSPSISSRSSSSSYYPEGTSDFVGLHSPR